MIIEENIIDVCPKTKKTQKKKRSRKGSKETTIKTFFKEECKKDTNASTPLSAKK